MNIACMDPYILSQMYLLIYHPSNSVNAFINDIYQTDNTID